MRHYQGVTWRFWESEFLRNNGKNDISKSPLSQHIMCFPNAAGIHWPYMGVGGVSSLMGSRNETLTAPDILSYLKSENN